jgi:hypothetical protein
MSTRYILRRAITSTVVVGACACASAGFLSAPVLTVLSISAWSAVGVVSAIILGSACRLLIRDGAIMVLLAAVGVVSGAVGAEIYNPPPLSHDTTASQTLAAFAESALHTWPYQAAAVVTIMLGWFLASRGVGLHCMRDSGLRDR